MAPLARRGDEVGGLLALLLFADRGLVPDVDEAIDSRAFEYFAPVRIPALPYFWFVNGRQCEGRCGGDFGELLLDATKRPAPFCPPPAAPYHAITRRQLIDRNIWERELPQISLSAVGWTSYSASDCSSASI